MKKWLRSGLVWGGLLYILTIIAFPLLDGERLTTHKILLGIPLWILVGMSIGFLFDKNKKPRKRKARR